MKVSTVVTVVIKENTNVPVYSVTTMEVFNVGDVVVVFNGATLKAGERKTIVVADGTVSDVNLDVTFSEDFAGMAYVKRIEVIYKKLVECGN
ncbi:hypothetical protein [Flavobacterium undicola]|uniref:hypothetical protein n=1 Tax=Flavobacterium undicola TaxID=1932779 RepID=UPI001378E375|nr:hypothetical protein [Flavobacterium undicola]MBA0884926.1 hypothetical protein [Flavobacterium undicola]